MSPNIRVHIDELHVRGAHAPHVVADGLALELRRLLAEHGLPKAQTTSIDAIEAPLPRARPGVELGRAAAMAIHEGIDR